MHHFFDFSVYIYESVLNSPDKAISSRPCGIGISKGNIEYRF